MFERLDADGVEGKIFDVVHALLKTGKATQVRKRLVNGRTGRLGQAYAWNANHVLISTRM